MQHLSLRAMQRRQFSLTALTAAAAFGLVVTGCQRQPRSVEATPQVSVMPMLGGMGGFLIQIAAADSDLVSVYHAPIQAFDRDQATGEDVPFQLLFQFRSSDAGADVLPVRRLPPRSAVAANPPAVERK